MAFNNFYIGGGSDLNAGSTSADASGSNSPLVTYAGGTFVRATGVFTPASGNPVSDGVTVGMWGSVYTTAGAVAATFVGQVTARDATTITFSTTTILGLATSVSESAAASTCKIGGAWASEIVLAATGLGTFTVSASTKINIKQATYTIAASRTISMAGGTTKPLWFSGYNTTPGDLDNDTTNTLSKPILNTGANAISCTGAHQLLSGLSLSGNLNGTVLSFSSANGRLLRCRIENTNSGTAARALLLNSDGIAAYYCWCKQPTTATATAVVVVNTGTSLCVGCVVEGGGFSGFGVTGNLGIFVHCIAINNTGTGFQGTNGLMTIIGCTVYNPTTDGVRWSSAPAGNFQNPSVVIGCLFSNCGGYGINNASGGNVNTVFRACNDFYSCTSGAENGFGDSPAFFQQTDSSQVVTSSTDMTPVAGSNARAHGFPGIFENQSYSSYENIGAVRHPDPTGISRSRLVNAGAV